MFSLKVKLSKIKWWIIENVLVFPLKKILRSINYTILVRVLQSLETIGKLDYSDKTIVMDVKTVSQLSRLHSCSKEPFTIQWLKRDFRDGDVFFDIGANIGAYSMVAAVSTNKNISVYSFEPSPSTFATLCKNIFLNNLSNKVFPFQIAFGTKSEVSKFFLSSNVAGTAEHALGEPIDMFGNRFIPAAIQTVMSMTIDDFINIFRIDTPTHLKIDVDGFELNVLKGASNALSSNRLRNILLEVREDSVECLSIVELLRSFGFNYIRKGYVTTAGFCNYEFEKNI